MNKKGVKTEWKTFRDIFWRCRACDKLLGIVDKKTKQTLRIKHKDLYIDIENGKVTITCTKCGARNILESENNV